MYCWCELSIIPYNEVIKHQRSEERVKAASLQKKKKKQHFFREFLCYSNGNSMKAKLFWPCGCGGMAEHINFRVMAPSQQTKIVEPSGTHPL